MFAISTFPATAEKQYLSGSRSALIWCWWIFRESSHFVGSGDVSLESFRASEFERSATEEQVAATGVGDQAGSAKSVERNGNTFAAGANHAREFLLGKVDLNLDEFTGVATGLRGQPLQRLGNAARHVAREQAL